MKRKRKTGCLGVIITLLVIIGILIFAGRFLLFRVLNQGEDKELTLTETDKEQGDRKEIQVDSIPGQSKFTEEDELSGKFYYAKLSTEEQEVYREITAGVRERQEEIRVDYSDGNRANELFQYILMDLPEIFWCDGTVESVTYQTAEPYAIVKPGYLYSSEETEQKKAEVESAVQECLAGIAQDADDYDKILYVFEYLVNTIDYDRNVDNNQYIYSALVEKHSVCAGYSRATQYLLERLGVFCTYVTGTVKEGQSHAWNLVMCDGNYYYVDTTWGDPLFMEDAEEGNRDNICYDYMCCSDEELFKTHIPDGKIELPACTKMDANYYVMNGMYYTEYDSESIFEVMSADIRAGRGQSEFKFADSELYLQAHKDIFGNLMERAAKFLMEQYQLEQVRYQYRDDEQLNKIVIYWQYG